MTKRYLAPALLVAAAGALSGCYDGPHYHHANSGARPFSLPTCPSAATPVRGVTVDTGAELATEAGKGAGLLVEYMTGGHWHIFAVCDTAVSGYSCNFDVTAQVIGGKVSELQGEELESSDVVTSYCADTAVLGVTTSNDFDGMWFTTTPGATVRVTVALGETLYPDTFFWTSGAVVHGDAGANPVEFTPTAP